MGAIVVVTYMFASSLAQKQKDIGFSQRPLLSDLWAKQKELAALWSVPFEDIRFIELSDF